MVEKRIPNNSENNSEYFTAVNRILFKKIKTQNKKRGSCNRLPFFYAFFLSQTNFKISLKNS